MADLTLTHSGAELDAAIAKVLNDEFGIENLTAETILSDTDYLPFYDTSESVNRKTLWSNIKATLKTYFDTLYSLIGHTHAQSDISNLVNTLSGKEPTITTKNTAFNKSYGATATDVKVNGTQAVGTTDTIARIDHVHPVDTSRAASSHSHSSTDLPDASTTAQGVVQLSDSTTETSSVKAATPTAVKSAYDLANDAHTVANAALPKSGGVLTGILVAQNNTSYTTAQMRNVILSPTDAVVGSMGNGDIWIKYV